jgi:hypothetical protein
MLYSWLRIQISGVHARHVETRYQNEHVGKFLGKVNEELMKRI